MLGSKRTLLEILSSLLAVLEDNPCKKTALTTKANLDSKASRRYIDYLLQNGLISRDGDNFRITEEGRDFLKEYRKLEQFTTHSALR